MAIRTRIEPIDRDIQLILSETLSPQARSAALARFAEETIEDAQKRNARVLGRPPPYEVTVDGRKGAPLRSVKPDGVIVAEFELITNMLVWIDEQLRIHSPVGKGDDRRPGHPGLYKKSHVLFADGVEIEPTSLVKADEYAFVNTQKYARKIERGLSSQSPEGVYHAVQVLAAGRFGNQAKISLSFRTVQGGERNPAIIVRLRG